MSPTFGKKSSFTRGNLFLVFWAHKDQSIVSIIEKKRLCKIAYQYCSPKIRDYLPEKYRRMNILLSLKADEKEIEEISS